MFEWNGLHRAIARKFSYCCDAVCASSFIFDFVRPYAGNSQVSYVTPKIQQVSFYDVNTGTLTNVTGNWRLYSCNTGMETTSTNYTSECQFDSANYSPTATSSICRNAIKSIEYTFIHSQSAVSSIEGIDVVLIVQDILFDHTSAVPPSITQSYTVKWTDVPSPSSISNSSGNVIKR